MPNEPFYKTKAWRELREQRLIVDEGKCVVPGCGAAAVVVDHIDSTERGRLVPIARLRSLCRGHDNMVKEGANGRRRSGGVLRLKGCDVTGAPLDPGHWWSTGKR